MAAPKRVNIDDYSEVPLEDEPADPIEEAEQKEELQLRNAMAQFMGESGAKLYIYDMNSKSANGAGVFVEKLALTDHDHDEILERLRDVHFGGDFKLQIRNKNGHIQMNQLVSVVKKEKPTPEEERKDDIAAIINAVKDNSQNNSHEMLQLMMQQSQQQMQAMMQQSQQQMLLMMETLKSLKPDAPPPLTSKDMLAMLVSMKELNATDTPAVDPMDNFIKGLTMGKEMGEGGNDSALSTAIKAFAPGFNSITEQLRNAAPTVPATATSAAPAAAPSTEQLPEPEKMKVLEAQKVLAKLQPLITLCHAGATDGKAVETYAQLLLDQLEPDIVAQYIGVDSYYEKLFQWRPELQAQRHWFDQLRATVVELINAPPLTDSENHVPDPTADVPTSPLEALTGTAPHRRQSITRIMDAPAVSSEPDLDDPDNAN